jgi:hypothetical protein
MCASGSNITGLRPLLVEDELLGSLPDAALDGSQELHPAIVIGLTILDAADAN